MDHDVHACAISAVMSSSRSSRKLEIVQDGKISSPFSVSKFTHKNKQEALIIIIISFAWLFDEREVFMGLIHNRVAKVFHGNNSLNPWR